MFDNDFIFSFFIMAVLFLRQVSILKQENKLNYSPLMLGVGAISGIIHFIIHPENTNFLLIMRESFFPLLISLILYIVMNIIHQTIQTKYHRSQHEFTTTLISQITQLKKFSSDLEQRMIIIQEEDRNIRKQEQDKFEKDIAVLDAMKINQGKFLEKFNNLESLHKDVNRAFVNFSKVQLPTLDNVIHEHIDILRVAEHDHYNHIKTALTQAVDNRANISQDIDELRESLLSMKHLSSDIASSIVNNTVAELSNVSSDFEKQIINLKSHTESISTTLTEGETRLDNIRDKSELIMEQMVLSSNQMSKLEIQNTSLTDIESNFKDIVKDMKYIKADYVKAQSELNFIASDLKASHEKDMVGVKAQVEMLVEELTAKIENSLEKLHKHYHIANEDISQSVQFLAKQAQLKKGYTE
jgi:hypothetical protein